MKTRVPSFKTGKCVAPVEQIKPNTGREAAHPISVGDMVTVISLNADVAFIEGLAIIKEIVSEAHRYRVRFVGDPRVRKRLVHTTYQRDAVGAVEWLNELLRSSREPDSDEFFPADDRYGERDDEPQ